MRDLEFVQQLVTKFCHELSGPIGAVNHGIEAYDDGNGPDMLDRIIEMTRNSSRASLGRLMFFRACYGVYKSSSDVSLASVKVVAANYLEDYGINLIFDSDKKEKILFNNHGIKIFLCLVCLGAKALSQAGSIEAMSFLDSDNKKKISVICRGPKISSDMLKLDILEGRRSDIVDTSESHSYYTKRVLDDIGAELKINYDSEKLEFTVTIISV